MATSRYLFDITLRFQVYLERLKAGQMASFDPTLRAMDRSIRRAVAAAGSGQINELSVRQLNGLLRGLRSELGELTGSYRAFLDGQLEQLADIGAAFEAQALRGATVASVAQGVATVASGEAWAAALAQPVQATGKLLQPFIKGWEASILDAVEGTIRNGYAQGRTTDQIVRELRGTRASRYTDGVLTGTGRRQTQAMVRTAVQHSASAGRMSTLEANSDIISGYRWVSTLDSRTTTTCKSLDGRVFKLGEGPVPPIHVGCRSTVVAELAGVDLLAHTTRASRGAAGGKQVPADQSYYEWLKTQPKEFQDDALGPVRGVLFREGGLSAKEFAALNLDRNFQPLTIEEMRQKTPQAFKRAGIN